MSAISVGFDAIAGPVGQTDTMSGPVVSAMLVATQQAAKAVGNVVSIVEGGDAPVQIPAEVIVSSSPKLFLNPFQGNLYHVYHEVLLVMYFSSINGVEVSGMDVNAFLHDTTSLFQHFRKPLMT